MRIDKTSHVDPRISHAVVIVACQSRVNDTPVTLIRSRSDKQFLQRYYFVFLQTFANEFFPERKKKLIKGKLRKVDQRLENLWGMKLRAMEESASDEKRGKKRGRYFVEISG